MFVCLSVSKITQKTRMDLDEIVHVDSYRDMDELVNFKPDLDHSPDAGTGKSEIESRSNRHLTQSRLQVMHCREILFTPRCSPRAREFPRLLNFFCTTYGCGATGRHTWPIVGFRPIFQYTTYTYWRGPTLQQRVVLEWFYSVTRRNNFVGGTCAPPSDLLVICLFPVRWYVWCDGVI